MPVIHLRQDYRSEISAGCRALFAQRLPGAVANQFFYCILQVQEQYMEEPFLLPVLYKGETHHFEAQLRVTGYTHRFEVQVNNEPVFFEPDEEGMYRAVAATPQQRHHQPDIALLTAISNAIKAVLD